MKVKMNFNLKKLSLSQVSDKSRRVNHKSMKGIVMDK